MEKYLMNGSKNDLKCDSHPNFSALFLQINSKINNQEQNKLLCFQCLEKLNAISNLISVDALIEKMKSKYEENFDTRKGILTLIIDQLAEADNQIEKIFKILHDSLKEWKNQLQGIINQPIQFDLKQEIYLASDQNFQKPYFNDTISQLYNHFSNSISKNLTQLNETLRLTKIKEIYEKFNFESQKQDFNSFPKVVELMNEIDSKGKLIYSIEFNFDNSLLFFAYQREILSFSFESKQQEVIVSDLFFPNIASSKNKNLIAVYSKNQCSLWCCDKSQKWSNLGTFKDENLTPLIYLNSNDTQIIARTKNNCVSIVQINYEKKTLYKIQQISNFLTFHVSKLSSKILLCQKSCFLIYKQQRDNNQWILQDKISVSQNESIINARFIQNDDIIVKYKTENSEQNIMHFDQKQLIRFEPQNANLKIDEKKFLFYPRSFNKQRQLYLQQNQNKIYFIKMQNGNFSVDQQSINLTENKIEFKWSIDGRIIVVVTLNSFKINIYQLTYY